MSNEFHPDALLRFAGSVGRMVLAFAIAFLATNVLGSAFGAGGRADQTIADWIAVGGLATTAATMAAPLLVRAAFHLGSFWVLRIAIGADWEEPEVAAFFFSGAGAFFAALGFAAFERWERAGDARGEASDRQFSTGTLLAGIFLVSAYVAIGRGFWAAWEPNAISLSVAAFFGFVVPQRFVRLMRRVVGPLAGTVMATSCLAAVAFGVASSWLSAAMLLTLFVAMTTLDSGDERRRDAKIAETGSTPAV